MRSLAEVTTAVAAGDLSKKIHVEAFGEILDMKETVNNMVDSLRSFSSEVTRSVHAHVTERNKRS